MNNYVPKIVNNRWEMVIPITMDILQTKVLYHVKIHIQESNYKFFSQDYLEDIKKIKMFLKCSLEHSQFINICSSVSQKNPPNWK